MNPRERRGTVARVGVESLEGRVVLSTAGTSMIASPTGTAPGQGPAYLDIQGSGHGSVLSTRHNPDTGTAEVLLGSATVKGEGPVLITGTVQGTGNIARGQAGGSITISDARGDLTLKLTGPTTAGSTAPKSGTYQFTVESGTGGFARTFGNGTVALTLGAKSFRLAFHGAPNRY